MDKRDAQRFEDELVASMELYGQSAPSQAAKRKWWMALAGYPLQAVLQAFAVHEKASKFAPKPADIIEAINAQDGRLGVDEAWAIALDAMSEETTVVWSEEIAQAYIVASPIYAQGDKVGARMAFKNHYTDSVTKAREMQKPVAWKVSLGSDQAGRKMALEHAVRANRLTDQQAKTFLPAPEVTNEGAAIAGLLTGNIFDLKDHVELRERLNAVREAISSRNITDRQREEKVAYHEEIERRRKKQLIAVETAMEYEGGEVAHDTRRAK